MPWRLSGGGGWAEVVKTSPDRKVVGAGPVDSRHGSYQLVSWWGGHCLCPSMAHTRWWQSRAAIRDVAACVLISPKTDSCHAMRFGASYVADRSAACHHLGCAMGGHKQWPPHHDTNWYDPWRLPTGPAPTTFRSGEDLTTSAHSSPTTTTALVGPQPCTERAL